MYTLPLRCSDCDCVWDGDSLANWNMLLLRCCSWPVLSESWPRRLIMLPLRSVCCWLLPPPMSPRVLPSSWLCCCCATFDTEAACLSLDNACLAVCGGSCEPDPFQRGRKRLSSSSDGGLVSVLPMPAGNCCCKCCCCCSCSCCNCSWCSCCCCCCVKSKMEFLRLFGPLGRPTRLPPAGEGGGSRRERENKQC